MHRAIQNSRRVIDKLLFMTVLRLCKIRESAQFIFHGPCKVHRHPGCNVPVPIDCGPEVLRLRSTLFIFSSGMAT